MQHNPRKRFGQNFLTDVSVIAQIIAEIAPQKTDCIVEIGPGLGALTRPLLKIIDHLHAIEIDRDLATRLQTEFLPEHLTVHAVDALRFDFAHFGRRLRIVGNLPYNISTPLLFHLSRFSHHILDMHFMLQKEVVERMVAAPSTSDYGRLSVMLQYRFDMECVLGVSAACFRPVPKVESAVVRLNPRRQEPLTANNESLLAEIVAAAFSQRRKTLRNTLQRYLVPNDFAALNIDPGLRAENLSVERYVAIANHLDLEFGV
ncbi:MAG: 16S rRNA (adenine(1518)-N(6)/adenine(1519)-N(6))-dimethyltransferase RsmA [Nitrosomonas sp.]|nr:MAG: 16S rRNA (adenine(1518)-N(6)/adenine(1519)-N(6))-dimethyltransferase RsmA [Nitrosomonas sp.]